MEYLIAYVISIHIACTYLAYRSDKMRHRIEKLEKKCGEALKGY